MINVGQIEIGVRGWNLFSHVWLSVCRRVSPWLSYIFGFVGLVRNEILQSVNPKDRERESNPCVNLHREISSASVERCETEVCFLHIQLIGTNV